MGQNDEKEPRTGRLHCRQMEQPTRYVLILEQEMDLYNGENQCYLFNPGLKLGITKRRTKMLTYLLA